MFTKEQRLDLYKVALKDWEKPYIPRTYTNCGFCNYFFLKHNIADIFRMFKSILPELYKERKIKYGCFHYSLDGDTIEGRQERIQALKNAIKKIEDELKL